MRQLVDRSEASADRIAGYALPACHADDCGVRFRTDPPNVQIRNPSIPWRLDQFADFVRNMIVGRIKQDQGGFAHQRP